MSFRYFRFPAILLAFATTASVAAPVVANERAYFKSVEGKWSGSGGIVAGKYKGTKFTCRFNGATPAGVGMDISGTCRVGLFSQKISAKIQKSGRSYRGIFLDGAKGKGLDIVSGRLRSNRLTVNINRKKLNGAMVANLTSPNSMRISISVRVKNRLIPVMGLNLNRNGVGKTAYTE